MCVRCCQPFVAEAASGVSDVDPNGHVVRLSFVRFWFLRCHSVVVYGLVFSLSFVVSEIDHGLVRSIRFLGWICCSLLTLFFGSIRLLFLNWILEALLLEPSLADQIST